MPWPPSPEEVETALRAYEVMVILDPSLEERTVEPSLAKYLNVITKDGEDVHAAAALAHRRCPESGPDDRLGLGCGLGLRRGGRGGGYYRYSRWGTGGGP